MNNFVLVFFFYAIMMLGIGFVTYHDMKNQHVERLAKIKTNERSQLNEMCAAYFEWSKTAKERVSGMETQCAGE